MPVVKLLLFVVVLVAWFYWLTLQVPISPIGHLEHVEEDHLNGGTGWMTVGKAQELHFFRDNRIMCKKLGGRMIEINGLYMVCL